MGNSIADRKIKQVSEMKHLEVKENFDYYNSIIDEIQENLDRLIADYGNIENMTEFLWNNKIAKYWNCGYLICEL